MAFDPFLAISVGAQAIRVIGDFMDRAGRGQVTTAEVDAMAAKFQMNLDGLRADIEARKAAAPAS